MQRSTTMMSPVGQSNNNNEPPSTPQQQNAPSRSTRYAHHHSPLTKVNGKGLWRSWKRNFQSKLLALMDLIDNSLDAAVMDDVEGVVPTATTRSECSLVFGSILIINAYILFL